MNINNNNKTFKKAPHSIYSNLPVLSEEEKTKSYSDSSLQSQSMQKSYISNIKIQIHKITIETK